MGDEHVAAHSSICSDYEVISPSTASNYVVVEPQMVSDCDDEDVALGLVETLRVNR